MTKKNDGVPPRHSYLNMLYVRMFNNLADHNRIAQRLVYASLQVLVTPSS
jgi:hypothetical protein